MRAHLINVSDNLLGSNTAWRTPGTEKYEVIHHRALAPDVSAGQPLDLGVLYGV